MVVISCTFWTSLEIYIYIYSWYMNVYRPSSHSIFVSLFQLQLLFYVLILACGYGEEGY